jgi:hypothetical protein
MYLKLEDILASMGAPETDGDEPELELEPDVQALIEAPSSYGTGDAPLSEVVPSPEDTRMIRRAFEPYE